MCAARDRVQPECGTGAASEQHSGAGGEWTALRDLGLALSRRTRRGGPRPEARPPAVPLGRALPSARAAMARARFRPPLQAVPLAPRPALILLYAHSKSSLILT